MKKILFALLIVLWSVVFVCADTIYLRDGRTVRGTVLGFINGRFVVRLYGDRRSVSPAPAPRDSDRPAAGDSRSPVLGEDGEIVFFRPNEIDRIELDGRSLDDARFDTRTVQVALGSNWIDSGVDVRRNERVRINASGTIVAGRARITPDGLPSNDPNAPLPRAAEGLLIGAVGNDSDSPVVELGTSHEFVADRDGRLYLTANRSSYTDARGAFTVEIRRERDLAALTDDRNNERNQSRRRDESAPIRSRTPQRRTDDLPRNRQPAEVTIDVSGTSRGTDTNIDVHAGDQITFTATGTIVAGRRLGQVGPEGGRATGFGAVVNARPVPSAGPGALVGYLRLTNGQTSQPFKIGAQLTFTAQSDGRLFLVINDDDYSDNSGSFSVKVRYQPTAPNEP
jgi:hypothetical protein